MACKGAILIECLRKIAIFLSGRGHAAVEEIEKAVFLDGSADGSADLVASVVGLGVAVFVGKEIVGVQGGALAEPIAGAVNPVGARFTDDIDDRSAIAAVLGREPVRLDSEFADNR